MKGTLAAAATLALLAALAGGAHAQTYKWIEKDGKVMYGNTPPPGVKATPLKPPPAPAGPPPAAAKDAPAKDASAKDAAAKDVKKGPMTPAEQEQDYRRRQQEAQKGRDKADQEAKQAAALQENCSNAQEYLRTLQSGQRIQRTDSKGERYYLDDAGVASELAKAQKVADDSCK